MTKWNPKQNNNSLVSC